MHSTIFILALLCVYCTATQQWPKGDEAEVKTTLLTLTKKPCSSSTTTSVVIAKDTHAPWPAKEVVKNIYTPSAVIHETWTTSKPPAEVKNTAVHTPKVEEWTSTTTSTSTTTTTTTVMQHTSTAPPVDQKNTEIPPVQHESTSTTKVYVPKTTQATSAPPIKQDTSAPYTKPTITTSTTLAMQHATTTSIVQPPATTTNPVKTYTVIPTAATCTCPPSTLDPPPTESTTPKFPLKAPELQAIDSLLSLLLSIPDAILSGDSPEAISTFYTNLSTCVGSKGSTLKQSFLEFSNSFDTIGAEITKGVQEAGNFIDDLLDDNIPKATSVIGDIISEVTAVPDKIVSAIGPVVSDIFNLNANSISSVSKRQADAPNPIKSIGEIVTGIDALRACLTSAIATNPLFEVAKCAASIASAAFPVARVLRARGLVAGVGGKVKVLLELGRARKAADVGKGVLDLVGELTGIADVVRDCKVLVD